MELNTNNKEDVLWQEISKKYCHASINNLIEYYYNKYESDVIEAVSDIYINIPVIYIKIMFKLVLESLLNDRYSYEYKLLFKYHIIIEMEKLLQYYDNSLKCSF